MVPEGLTRSWGRLSRASCMRRRARRKASVREADTGVSCHGVGEMGPTGMLEGGVAGIGWGEAYLARCEWNFAG